MDDAFSCLGLIEASRQGILNHLVSIIFLNECIIFILHGIASHRIKEKKIYLQTKPSTAVLD